MDNDLLLNFSLGQQLLQEKNVLKGGRWKDRRRASRLFHQSDKERSEDAAAFERSYVTGNEESTTETKDSKGEDYFPRKVRKLHHSSNKPNIVSSLFMGNPSVTSVENTHDDPDQYSVHPSNAALPADVNNFVALGLYPSLASHLESSLHLSSPTAIQKAAIPLLLQEESDFLVQAETGSGKTLAFLLPILQNLLDFKSRRLDGKMDRKSGLFVLILVPTRELARQIDETLTLLLNRMPWLVHGTVSGGATKNHEKARIRRGINVLVATPGRLVDHIENTQVLDLQKVKWFVLDEGDRLMELGFEQDILKIIGALERSRRPDRYGQTFPTLAHSSYFKPSQMPEKEASQDDMATFPTRMTTILCSATMKADVERLGKVSLNDAKFVNAVSQTSTVPEGGQDTSLADSELHLDRREKLNSVKQRESICSPSQLRQSYVVVPPKQRLVTLKVVLERALSNERGPTKVVVFFSCADSVEFHFAVFGRTGIPSDMASSAEDKVTANVSCSLKDEQGVSSTENCSNQHSRIGRTYPLPTKTACHTLSTLAHPRIQLFKIYGSLQQQLRSATIAKFSSSSEPSILFSTDLASRGLDLPNVDLVVEYDPAFSSDDHLHRVGRTARAGKEGTAICFLMPGSEEGYISVLKAAAGKETIRGETAETVLRSGVKHGRHHVKDMPGKWDEVATDWQLDIERWIINDDRAAKLARKAYVSHVRAYATHVSDERHIFDLKGLHLGHLAKAFGLRETPRNMGHTKSSETTKQTRWPWVNARKGKKEGQGQETRVAVQSKPVGRVTNVAKKTTNGAAEKMRLKIKEHMAVAGEFNIG